MDSPDRADFLAGLKSGGKYDGIVGIYRENRSANRISVFDKEIVRLFAETGIVKWIAHCGAGYDQIDVLECAAQGINVSNTPGAVDEATATTTLYLILSTLRHFSKAERSLHAGTSKTPISPADVVKALILEDHSQEGGSTSAALIALARSSSDNTVNADFRSFPTSISTSTLEPEPAPSTLGGD